MEILAVVFSILAVTIAVIALTTMVLDSAHRSSLLNLMKEREEAFAQSVKGLKEAHDNVVKGMQEMSDRLETAELQIKSLTLGTHAPKRVF